MGRVQRQFGRGVPGRIAPARRWLVVGRPAVSGPVAGAVWPGAVSLGHRDLGPEFGHGVGSQSRRSSGLAYPTKTKTSYTQYIHGILTPTLSQLMQIRQIRARVVGVDVRIIPCGDS